MQNIDTLMEDYILGNLSPEDVKKFEQFLAQDPKHRSDLELQKDILEGIKQHSRQQLKSKLAQVNPHAGRLITQKIAVVVATFAAAALVGIGIYSTVQDGQTALPSQTPQPSMSLISPTESPQLVELEMEASPLIKDEAVSAKTTEKNIPQNLDIQKIEAPKSVKKAPKIVEEIIHSPTKKTNKAFNPLKDLAQNDEKELGTDSKLVTEMGTNPASKKATNIDRVECQGNKKIESYRFQDGLLEICGEFSSKNTFEITVSEALGHAIFFSYDGAYYQIIESPNYEKMSDHKITDQKTIQKITQP